MTFFYRLHTKNSISSGAKLGYRETVYDTRPNGWPIDYDYKWAIKPIPTDEPWPHAELLKRPMTSPLFMDCYYVFKSTGERPMPEIWTESAYLIVSERVKDMILAFDDFGHEAKPTKVVDRKGRPISDLSFWHINIRRYLRIEELPVEPFGYNDLQFVPNSFEKKCFPTIRDTPALLEKVAALPIWRDASLGGDFTRYYLSAGLFNHLNDAGVTGLVPQKNAHFPRSPESITRFPY